MNLSASKTVFVMIASTACLAFLWLVWKGTVVLDNKDFMILAGAAFGYFFGAQPQKPDVPGEIGQLK